MTRSGGARHPSGTTGVALLVVDLAEPGGSRNVLSETRDRRLSVCPELIRDRSRWL